MQVFRAGLWSPYNERAFKSPMKAAAFISLMSVSKYKNYSLRGLASEIASGRWTANAVNHHTGNASMVTFHRSAGHYQLIVS